MTTEHTEEDLRALLKSFKDGLILYSATLANSPLSQLQTQHIPNADLELAKVAKLLFAHATKLGIAFRPPVSINAAYEVIRDTSQKLLLIVSVTAQFADEKVWSVLFQKEVVAKVQDVITSFISLLEELEALGFNEKRKEKDEEDNTQVNGRLVSVGKVWDSCNALEALMGSGKLGFLKKRIQLSIGIIDDAMEEFNEWIENPEIMDDEDPFGFADAQDKDDEDDDDEDKDEIDEQTLELAEKWSQKIKMLKLLLGSLAKSLPTSNDTSGADIDEFQKEQNALVEQVDDLVAAFFLNSGMPQIKTQTRTIEKQSWLLIALVRKLNNGDDKKTKWLDLWQEKFQL